MNISAALRASAKRESHKRFLKEAERIISNFASSPNTTTRVTTKMLKHLLLNGPYYLNGESWEINKKSLGAGIYEIGITLKKYPE